ncbi:hypothetical protein EV384_4962 [Micromonospora kangleipakensis]|uniref:Uncharacterized protein n=1 Tax=Micromonospora kangleipakensis TaxID=1077942 RepID=A0A4Q8BEG3_9ACTN|nr:hypothetical protein EV384_4962 [Micromonospora kangleipakensis]
MAPRPCSDGSCRCTRCTASPPLTAARSSRDSPARMTFGPCRPSRTPAVCPRPPKALSQLTWVAGHAGCAEDGRLTGRLLLQGPISARRRVAGDPPVASANGCRSRRLRRAVPSSPCSDQAQLRASGSDGATAEGSSRRPRGKPQRDRPSRLSPRTATRSCTSALPSCRSCCDGEAVSALGQACRRSRSLAVCRSVWGSGGSGGQEYGDGDHQASSLERSMEVRVLRSQRRLSGSRQSAFFIVAVLVTVGAGPGVYMRRGFR